MDASVVVLLHTHTLIVMAIVLWLSLLSLTHPTRFIELKRLLNQLLFMLRQMTLKFLCRQVHHRQNWLEKVFLFAEELRSILLF